MKPLIIEIEPEEIPEPEDYQAELAVLQKIIDFCEAGDTAAAFRVASSEKNTAWLANQLATYAGIVARSDILQGYELASLSLKIAYQAGNAAQIYNSLLNWASMLLRDENFDEAEIVCLDIIDSLLPGGIQAKAFSHMTLGGIYNGRGTRESDDLLLRKAIYHYERGLRYLRGKITGEVHEEILHQLLPLYRQTGDLAGLACCVARLTDKDAKSLLRDQITASFDLEYIVSLTTRLNSLDEHQMADVVFQTWQERLKQQ